jgi:hypothetical protein
LAHVYVILCLRFSYVITFTPARLDMGGWFCLTQQGLAPCKKRQASLGAHSILFKMVSPPMNLKAALNRVSHDELDIDDL